MKERRHVTIVELTILMFFVAITFDGSSAESAVRITCVSVPFRDRASTAGMTVQAVCCRDLLTLSEV